MSKLKIGIVGTNGIPAKYGGYETLVEFLTKGLYSDFDFIIYCSRSKEKKLKNYNQSRLIHLPLKANGWQSIIYDIISLLHAIVKADVILYLGPGAGFIIPFLKLFAKKIIINHGGLNEWEREKYSTFQKFIARLGHKYAAKYATHNITDNSLLRDSILNQFGVNSIIIRYGGDHVKYVPIDDNLISKYAFLKNNYYVNVSRAQVDNNLHLVLKAFENLNDHNLVMISNWDISEYGRNLKKNYLNKYPNIYIFDAIYEPRELNIIRGNAQVYIHSHSYCGTSPSLVEAMSFGLPIFSYDVQTNRETTKNKAFFYKNVTELKVLIEKASSDELQKNGIEIRAIADTEYKWDFICQQYSNLFQKNN